MIQIKSKGYIKQNDNNHVEGLKWNADYDGNKANILLDVNHNGHVQHRKIQLRNKELGTLAKLLSVPSVNKPLEKRLFDDYEDEEDDYDRSNMFQNYISTPRRMKRRNTPQIIRIKLEPAEEEEFPDFYESEEEEEENETPDPSEEMRMAQLFNEITQPIQQGLPKNQSHKKKPKRKRNPTRKVRFSPDRTKKKRKHSYGGKKHNTRRRLKR
jgi:hypothetical protein